MECIGKNEINNKLDDFKKHLEHADRMILSAKFGDGKSFFLQKAREDKIRFENYDFFTIYPVNYSVAKNEDIFEYIKRDIIIQLKERNVLDKIDIDALFDSVLDFADLSSLVSFLLSFVAGGAFYDKIIKKVGEVKGRYDKKKHTADKFLTVFNQIRGCIYEDDAYTKLINAAIEWMGNDHVTNGPEWNAKKTVLIIEDLDRLDPAHLFRILNVISAHLEDNKRPDKVGNKFGFSNIVIVMDYDTTHHIFEHFYGKSASYEGYMSKFLSEEPFRYSITDIALTELKKKIIEDVNIDEILFSNMEILNRKLKELSIRNIIRLHEFEISTRIRRNYIGRSNDMLFSTSLPIFKLILYMIELGMSIGDMNEDLVLRDEYNEVEYLNLLYPLYALINNNSQMEFVTNKNDSKIGVRVSCEKKNNTIISIRTDCFGSYSMKAPSIKTISRKYAPILKYFGTNLDMACLNQSDNYTIDYIPKIKLG